MPDRICFVYIWATSGGVERVFLNRAEALLRRYPELSIDVYFYQDLGGGALFSRYIAARGLGDRLALAPKFEPSRYDAIFTVDTPQILADHPRIRDKVFVECHTPYANQRTYLQQWQTRLRTLIVPSQPFQKVVESECPALCGKIQVVRNFVPRFPEMDSPARLPAWRLPLFLFFGRIDENKNFTEFAEALANTRERLRRDVLGVVCGPVVPDYPIQEVIRRSGAAGSVILLPPVPFENGHILMRLLRRKQAVYVSPSKGESFGLSAAEAMTEGLPVVLSNIPPHAMLVSGCSKFLYGLGNVHELAAKMAASIEQYDALSAECLSLARSFSEEAFLEDWERLFAPAAEAVLTVNR